MIGIPLGLLAANVTEWVVHKYVLHGAGKKNKSFWAFHWHEHHGNSRKNGFVDETYERSLFGWHAQSKETAVIAAAAVSSIPLFPVAPFFIGTMWYSAYNYYRKHKRAHLDPDWARENLAWHYDHHMGPNQDANWCVTHPFFDHVMGTRKPYAHTEREARDIERKKKRQARKQAKVAKAPTPSSPPVPAAAA
ncbi:MAG: sterol desaturase family protein [Deltaproteobacteria bacterium]|nr:sterol desaturase family protein [Deltaproteobacteria bacterium]